MENVVAPKINLEHVVVWIKNTIEACNKTNGDISIVLCDDEYLLSINRKYLNHDYFTDIITFDYSENTIISGDLFISLDRVKENALEFKVTYEQEFLRVVIHGVLHLLGFNDKTIEDQEIMRSQENKFLKEYGDVNFI